MKAYRVWVTWIDDGDTNYDSPAFELRGRAEKWLNDRQPQFKSGELDIREEEIPGELTVYGDTFSTCMVMLGFDDYLTDVRTLA